MYKHLNFKLKGPALIEFWIVTGCIVLSFILSLIDEIRLNEINHTYFIGILAPVLFNHIIVFLCYTFLCFYMAPVFENQTHTSPGGTLFILIFIYACITLGIINLYFAVLLAIKILLVFFNRDTRNTANMLYYDAALLTATWILLIVTSLYLALPEGVKFVIAFTVPATMVVYLYSVHRVLPATFLPKKAMPFIMAA